LLIGALLSLVGGVVVLIDQLGADTIWRHLQQVYPAGYSAAELVDDKSALVTILYSLTGLAILGWLTALALVRRRSRWAKPVTLGLFVVGGLTTTAGLMGDRRGLRQTAADLAGPDLRRPGRRRSGRHRCVTAHSAVGSRSLGLTA
jgi:hypothetical protein